MADVSGLVRSPLFSGLGAAELEIVAERARSRSFEPGEELCRAGEPSDRCLVITAGLVDAFGASGGDRAGAVLGRHRKGATIGEVSAILGEVQPERVVASIPTTALELSASELRELVQRFPVILMNVLRTTHGRLAHARARSIERQLGETVAIAAGPSLAGVLGRLVATVRDASPRSVIAVDRHFSFAGAVTAAEDLVAVHATVLLPAELDVQAIAALLRESDRVVALVATAADAAVLAQLRREPGARGNVEVVLVGREAVESSRRWPADGPLTVVRACSAENAPRLAEPDLSWLARHITRTKVGLALGAGGAKGYAHIGALQVLEEAGYEVDCVAGSSIGAIVGACLALGAKAAEIDATLRRVFDGAAVAEIFRPSLGGRATGLDLLSRSLREMTGERTFAQTAIPLTIMAVDLVERVPAPLREGPLWEALLAATALAGVFPPYERGGQRLVDGLALVPVPAGAVVQDGVDVTVSINLLSRETLPGWPSGPPPEPPPERRRRGVLDNLLEVMDLSQLAESERHAELADVVITPRFGPGEWRDFHLADLFLAAGREAAEAQLPALRALARPAVRTQTQSRMEGADFAGADPVRF